MYAALLGSGGGGKLLYLLDRSYRTTWKIKFVMDWHLSQPNRCAETGISVESLGLNKRSKHIALRYLFVQDIQATGLVNIQRVTSHNNPSDIYTKCVSAQVLEHHLRYNGIIELRIAEGEISYFSILQLAAQHINDSVDDFVHTREQRLRVYNKSFKNNFDNSSTKRRRTGATTSEDDIKKQHNAPTSSTTCTSSYKAFYKIKLLYIFSPRC